MSAYRLSFALRCRRFVTAGIALAVAALGGERGARAAAKTWDGGGSGLGTSWNTANNWNPNGVPGASDDVTISGGLIGINIDANVNVNSLTITGACTRAIAPTGSQTITIAGDLTLSSTSSGGSLTLSSATTQIGGRFNRSNGNTTINANGGTLVLNSTGSVTHTFNGAQLAAVTIGTASGLVGYWKVDESSGPSIADNSGYGNGGTLAGGYSRTTPPAAITFSDPNALTFDGTSGFASLGVNGLPGNNAVQSISTWVKLTSTATTQNMIALVDAASASSVQLGIRGGVLTAWGWGGGVLVSTTAPSTGVWHHVAYTWDGTTNRLYVDGGTPATSTTAHQTATPSAAYLGTYDGGSELYSGSLDDVRIYNRTLSSGEITTLSGGSNLSSGAGGTHTFGDAFVSTGTLTIGTGTLTGSSNFSVGGSWLNTGTFTGTGAITLTGTSSGNILVSGGSTFSSLTVNGSGGSYAFGDAIVTSGNFTISAATVTASSTMSVGGNWSNSGSFSGSGTVTLTRTTAGGTILSGGSSFAALTINGAGGSYTLQDRLWVPGGTVTLTNGTLNGGAFTAHIGSFSVGSGSFVAGTGTVILDGPSSQTLPIASFNGLRIDTGKEANLVGYWKLDGGAGSRIVDASGNGNHGSLSSAGTAWSASVPSAITFDDTRSVTFDGASGYATLGTTNLPANNAAQSISLWANLASTAGTQNMVALANAASASGVQLGVRAGALNVWAWGGTTLATATAPSTGSWHHVVYTWDGTTNKIYVDGGTPTTSTTAHQTATPTSAYLGTYNGGSELYDGSLDDVRVYSVALSATEVAQLFAGRYAGRGGYATVTLGADTTVAGQFAIDAGELSSGARAMTNSLTTSAAAINTGTYTVGSAAQQFQGGLTVQPTGALALATSGGSVQIADTKTLTMNGTLTASTTGATIRSVSGTYGFSVGSTPSARPTLNINGLAVQNTGANGMQINVDHGAVTTFTRFDNLVFTSGTGTFLNIYATALYLASSGARFGITTGGVSDGTLPTNNVTLTGNGTADGETRIVFGSATCAAAQTSSGTCLHAWASDDDPDGNGVGNTPATNGSVVQYVRGAATDTAGSIEGFPTAAFDWNTGAYYSTYFAYHDTSGTTDTIYVRDQSGAARYQWNTASGETIVGVPRWTTSGTTHYVFVALASGKVYRLVDNGSSLVPDSSGSWAGVNNPFDCGCTIVTPLATDASNLYWGGTTSGPTTQKIWTLGQTSRSQPTGSPFAITPVITSAAPSIWTSGSTSYLFMGLVGNAIKFNASAETLDSTNTNPGSAAIRGRILPTLVARVFFGDDGGRMWAVDPNTFAGTNKLWSYTVAGDSIQSQPYYDYTGGILQFGTDAGKIVALDTNANGAVKTGYPYVPGTTSDAIRSALLYFNGVLAVGTTTGKLFFIDRNNGTTGPALIREYYFGPTESVSGVGYDSNSSRYMVSTADPSSNDGKLYYIDLIADPTPSTL